MQPAALEHVNITVRDPEATAAMLCDLFDWKVRWQGPSAMGGRTVHVGNDSAYLAVYTHDGEDTQPPVNRNTRGALNHVGIVVDDLALAQERIEAAGFATFNHADYEPGRRFYFNDRDGIEYEIVHYP